MVAVFVFVVVVRCWCLCLLASSVFVVVVVGMMNNPVYLLTDGDRSRARKAPSLLAANLQGGETSTRETSGKDIIPRVETIETCVTLRVHKNLK